ncbi:MAG: glycosyltransferase [Saprospiraceae bacterium]|nr:glycosyltransferase [Saprospiraceae bacterium]
MIVNNNIVVFGIQSWDIKIGSNCKNIAMEFAKNNRVLYVSRPIDRINWLRPNKGELAKYRMDVLKKRVKPLVQVQKNLWALTPPIVMESVQWIGNYKLFQFFNKINNQRIAKSIIKYAAELGFDKFILFNDSAMFQGFYLKKLLQPELFIYYSRDYLISQPYFKKHGPKAEKEILKKADLVVTNSTYLANYTRKYNSNSHYVGQGCDFTIFKPQNIEKAHPLMDDIKGPVIGYVGLLTSHRLDIDLIEHIAKVRPDWSVVLVGSEDENFQKSNLHNLPNVHFLGFQKPEFLSEFIYGFDVCINPQILNQMTIGNYPRKIDEYLAMGKPVVAIKTEAMTVFKDYVKLANNKEEYILMIQELLDDNDPEVVNKRIQFANSHTWENSVQAIGTAIERTRKSKEFE